MDPISLNPYQNTQPANQTINLDTGVAPPVTPTPDQAQNKAAKATFALGDTMGKDQNEFYSDFMNGQEKNVRQQAAATVTQRNLTNRSQNVRQALADPNLTPEALHNLIVKPMMSDPKSVIEDQFAKTFTSPAVNLADPWNFGTLMPQAMQVMPQAVQEAKSEADTNLAWREYINDRTSKSQQLYNQQSTFGWAADQLKSYIPLYTEYKLRGWTGQIDWTNWLGDALNHQRIDLMRMPYGERKAKFDEIMDNLEKNNPGLAVMFGHAMDSMSRDQIEKMNISSGLNLATDATVISPLAKGAVGAVTKGVTLHTFAKNAMADAARAADLVNRADTAMADKYGFMYGVSREMAKSGLGNLTMWDVKAAAAAGQGNLAQSAVQQISRNIALERAGLVNPEEIVKQGMFTYFKTDANFMRTTAGNMGQDIANRISDNIVKSGIDLIKTVNNLQRVQRTPILVADQAVADLMKEQIKRRYSGPNSQVFGVGDPVWDAAVNRYQAPGYIGTQDGEMFNSPTQAMSAAEMNGWFSRRTAGGKFTKSTQLYKDFSIEQEGNGWYIKAMLPVDETENGLRDALIKMPNAWAGSASKEVRGGTGIPYLLDPLTGKASTRVWDVLQAYANSGFGKAGLRSPEETLSPVENEQRKIATFGASRLMEMFQPNNAIIKAGNTKAFKRLLTYAQSQIDPDVPEQSGVFYKGLADFKDAFQSVNTRLPTDKETEAYFAHKTNYEMERALRSLGMMRNKSRVGVMEYQIKGLDATGKLISSPYFDAIPIDKLPQDGNSVYVRTADRHFTLPSSNINSKVYRELMDQVDSGKAKVLKIWNREQQPLNEFAGDKMKEGSMPLYVVTDNTSYRPLQFENQVPRRGGGHWIYEYDHYLKQANVKYDPDGEQHLYLGDTTAMPFQLRALGEKVGDHLNTIREHLKAGNESAARDYTNKWGVAGLDFDKDIHPWFKSSRGPGGELMPARLNLTEPFRMVSANKKLIDIDDSISKRYENFLDATRTANPSQQFQIEFTGKRDAWDLHTIDDKGSWNNPVFQYRPAKLMDPIDALNRGMAKISNSTFMDDYKYMATEHWLQTFMPWIDAKSTDEIRHAPFAWFNKPDLWRKDAPPNVVMLGNSNRKKVQDFIGQPSAMKNAFNDIQSAIWDRMYKSGIRTSMIPYEALSLSKDPIAFTRSMVADAKLGLFSIPAFWMQMSAFSNIAAINPSQAAGATLGALFHQWARLAPQHLEHLDSVAAHGMLNWMPSMTKWQSGQLKESIELMVKSGFSTVGSEHAMFDSMLKDRGVSTAFDFVRYWGRTAFREGAQFVRSGAFHSAYLEFRAENPTGALSRADEAWILNRASLLDHDMNRASNSALNTGAMSFMTQFYNYARNLAEDMYGKRLTWQEKARLFTINGTLWGIPAGAVGLYGLPIGDQLRKYSEKYLKYVPGWSLAESIPMEGVLSALGAYITGKGDTQAGTWYDFSKFGVKNWDPINNFIDTDKSFLDFMGGATFSTAKNTILRSSNFLTDMHHLITGNTDKYPVKAQDFADLFKEVSSFSYAWKAIMAMNTHTYLSNNATALDSNVSTSDALIRYFTGLVPVNVSDITTNRQILGDQGSGASVLGRYVPGLASREAFINDMKSRIGRNFNLATLAARNEDLDGYQDYMTKIQTLFATMNLPPKERQNIMNELIKRQGMDLVQSLDKQLSTKDVPEDQMMSELERYSKTEILRRKRAGQQ